MCTNSPWVWRTRFTVISSITPASVSGNRGGPSRFFESGHDVCMQELQFSSQNDNGNGCGIMRALPIITLLYREKREYIWLFVKSYHIRKVSSKYWNLFPSEASVTIVKSMSNNRTTPPQHHHNTTTTPPHHHQGTSDYYCIIWDKSLSPTKRM